MRKGYIITVIALVGMALFGIVIASDDEQKIYILDCGPVKVPNSTGWCVPRIELTGDLVKIFEFGDCSRISGLSCNLRNNGKLPFPDKVLFDEYNDKGKLLAKGTRLRFYVDASKGGPERITGAMFWSKSNDPSRFVLSGIWDEKQKN